MAASEVGKGARSVKVNIWPCGGQRMAASEVGKGARPSGKHKIVAIKKFLVFFFAFPVLSGKFGKQSFKVPCSKNFLFWHYCLFVPEQKSSGSFEPLETILCFPDLFHGGDEPR